MISYKELPVKVQSLWDEVTALTGKSIIITHDPNINGDATVEYEGINVEIKFKNFITDKTVAHELLHVKYVFNGFKELGFYETTGHIQKIVEILQNLVQHRAFSPELESKGYPLATDESASVGRQLEQIPDNIDTVIRFDLGLCPYFATIYARAKLANTDPSNHQKIDSLFNQGELKNIKEKMGERLVQAIQQSDVSTVEGYNTTLQECIKILELQDDIEVES